MKMTVTSVMDPGVFVRLAAVMAVCFLLSLWVEEGRR